MKKFALALGGGSARGFAHIGVIQFLEENALKPSKIAGTSMGAIIGSLYALGFSSGEIHEIVSKVGVFEMLNFNISKGILSMQKVKKVLSESIGDKKFSDTKIPLSIITVNLDTGKKVIFSEWKILDAVCASIAIPGIFRPYRIGRERFIDGGMRENLPLSPCENLPIIASSVVTATGMDFQKTPFLKRWLSVVQEAISMLLEEQENFALSRHDNVRLLRTTEETTGYMDFSHLDLMEKEGYISASEADILNFLK